MMNRIHFDKTIFLFVIFEDVGFAVLRGVAWQNKYTVSATIAAEFNNVHHIPGNGKATVIT